MNKGFILRHNIQPIQSQTTCHWPGSYRK